MPSPYLLLPLRTEAEAREAAIKARAAEIRTGAWDGDDVPDIDDGWRFERLRDPYLSRQSYGGDT